MCGICGIVGGKGSAVSLNKLQEMNDIAIHRGPDDKGFAVFTENGEFNVASTIRELKTGKKYSIGLGHRRLSIIDLSQMGHQPMFDQTQRYCIVYNGELYNYKELREELKELDVKFFSNSDTEVILAAYITWGIDCLSKFNGMWAFAIYDKKDRTLFCSRDNFGIKPFYYICGDNYFVFSSEIKQIIKYCEDNISINEKILSEFLFWGYETHTEDTFFQNVLLLPPGHYLMIDTSDMKSSTFTPKKYWNYEINTGLSDNSAIDNFREIFIDSVRIRLRSDVPVGATLSGGLDSSSVACVMEALMRHQNINVLPKMFTSVYSDSGFSEKSYADAVVKKTGFQHVIVYPSSNDLKKHWERLIWHMEEPFGSLTYFSNWRVYEKCREEGIPVIMNGQGGDELLLGYERYRVAYVRELMKAHNIKKVMSEFFQIKKNANMSYSKQLLYLMYFSFPIIKILRNSLLVKPYLMKDFYNSYRKNDFSVIDELNNKDLIEMQLKEFNKYQLQHLLHHEDRVSMAFSIEARLPFLDYRLFNFVLSLDAQLKLNSGWSKYILRQALNGYLPESVKNRTDKMGYDTPSKRLLLDNKEFFLEILKRNLDDNYINVKNVMKDFTNDGINESLLCRIFTFLSWREAYHT
jgi:asparagine synthase (glutamine-hydrolysing)